MAEGVKMGESLPEFAIKTRLLSKKAEEKQKKEKPSRERELGPIYNDHRLNKQSGGMNGSYMFLSLHHSSSLPSS